jgi:hypothetical protein
MGNEFPPISLLILREVFSFLSLQLIYDLPVLVRIVFRKLMKLADIDDILVIQKKRKKR